MADGVSGVCTEGAAVGHASSTVSIMNLIRMGNTKVQKKFNCTYLREAAINVTKITTGLLPHPNRSFMELMPWIWSLTSVGWQKWMKECAPSI